MKTKFLTFLARRIQILGLLLLSGFVAAAATLYLSEPAVPAKAAEPAVQAAEGGCTRQSAAPSEHGCCATPASAAAEKQGECSHAAGADGSACSKDAHAH